MSKKMLTVFCCVLLITASITVGYGFYSYQKQSNTLDSNFQTTKSAYRIKRALLSGETPSVNDLYSFLNFSAQTYGDTVNQYKEFEAFSGNRTWFTVRFPYPKIKNQDYRRFVEQIKRDMEGLPEMALAAFKNDYLDFKMIIKNDAIDTQPKAISEIHKFKEKILLTKKMRLTLSPFKTDENQLYLKKIDIYLESGLSDIDQISQIMKGVVENKKQAMEIVIRNYQIIDSANLRLERMGSYAKSTEIKTVCEEWDDICDNFSHSISVLNDIDQNTEFSVMASHLTARDNDNLSESLSKASSHRQIVYDQYKIAKKQEANIIRNMNRSAQRTASTVKSWFEKKTRQASESRISKEIGVSVKMLILGSKMFYDFMDVQSSGDLYSWSTNYNNDISHLMNDVREIQDMDDASLTGKNTFIEDLVNKSYEASFKK